MKHALAGLVLMLACTALYGVDSGEDFADPILQARYEHLIHELRCLVCQNESIADSNAPLAADLRREVREMLGAGKQDAEILRLRQHPRSLSISRTRPTRTRHREQIAIPPGLRSLGGQGAVGAVGMEEVCEVEEDDM